MNFYVIDDHPLMREILVMLLRQLRPDAHIIELGSVGDFEAAVVRHGAPDLISLDLDLPDARGPSAVRELRRMCPDTPLVVLTASPANDQKLASMRAGADAYIEKSEGAEQILKVFGTFLDGAAAQGSAVAEPLSKRQRQLLVMLARGLSNRDIATELGISEATVKVHLFRLFRRLGVKSRTQSIHYARAHGLLEMT